MNTRLLEPEDIESAIRMILHDEIVVMPTETVYGLAGNAKSDIACKKIYAIKNRPYDNPLIVHCSDIAMAQYCMKTHPNDDEKKMIALGLAILEEFAPAPITVIVPASERISSVALAQNPQSGQAEPRAQSPERAGGQANGTTIAIRIPNHPLCRELIQKTGMPLAAPSANISGRPSATNGLMAWEALSGKVAGIINGGEASIGLESTIVDCCAGTSDGIPYIRIVREGAISARSITERTHIPVLAKEQSHTQVVPGNKYRHYAPHCEINCINLSMDYERMKIHIMNIIERNKNKRIAFAHVKNYVEKMLRNDTNDAFVFIRSYTHWKTFSQNLYELFAEADRRAVDILILPMPPKEAFPALYDRITRAML